MTKLHRRHFVAEQAGRKIDLNKLEGDAEARAQMREAGVSMDRLRRSDLNADGVLEAKEAFWAADHFDRDGRRASLVATTTDAQGQQVATRAGKTATVLGMLLQKDSLQDIPSKNDQPATSASGNDDILFVGMGNETKYSAGAKHEIRELGKSGANIKAITDSKIGDDKIRVGGETYDLTTEDGRSGFVGTLGLPAEQSQQIADVLKKTDRDGRDEMAQIAQVWGKGEKGESIPSRMVISGHHVGSAVWGDGNGRLSWDALGDLAKAMPNAASQVEDLHLSACYSGGQSKRDMFQGMFPNIKTIWAYSGSAPGTGSGATIHQAAWEKATRGEGTVEPAMQSLQRRGIRKANNLDVSTYEQKVAFEGPDIETVRQGIEAGESTFQSFFLGQEEVVSSQRGPLREYYNQIQDALQHPELTTEERTALEERRDQTIRGLYYNSHIRHRFHDAHADKIASGFSSLGLKTPDFEQLSRSEALEKIDLFRNTLQENPTQEGQDLLPLLNGLWNLDPQTIHETWI